MTNIFDYTLNELEDIFLKNGLKKFLAKQIFDWIYKKRVLNFDNMLNISKQNKLFLKNNFYIQLLKPIIVQKDPFDKTQKFLFELEDNNKIETVLMKFNYGYSVCVTTQVGCNMGCKFCASGLLKKTRNLHAYEIVNQIITVQKMLDENNDKISNIVVMGIGEPFDNYDNLSKFLNIITNQYGIGIGSRKITVSTCGLVPKIKQFAIDHKQIGLAISLHAPNNEIRNKLMPINNAYNIDLVLNAAKEYTNQTNRRITFEYIMLKDINDSSECAYELANRLKSILCYVNLIPYNSVNEHLFKRSDNVIDFANILLNNGITTTIRKEKGANIDAACGQLRSKNIN